MAAWYFTVVALLSGYALVYALLGLLQRLAPSSGLIRQYRQHFFAAFPLSAGVCWALQLYNALQVNNYFNTLVHEIPRNLFYSALLVLSVLSLLTLVKKVQQHRGWALGCSALVALVFAAHQLYPFTTVDALILRAVWQPLAVSTAWFIGLLFLLLLMAYLRSPKK